MSDTRGPVEIDLTAMGKGAVVVEGHDISKFVSSVVIRAGVRDVTMVTLELVAMDVLVRLDDAEILMRSEDGVEVLLAKHEEAVRFVTDSDSASGAEAVS